MALRHRRHHSQTPRQHDSQGLLPGHVGRGVLWQRAGDRRPREPTENIDDGIHVLAGFRRRDSVHGRGSQSSSRPPWNYRRQSHFVHSTCRRHILHDNAGVHRYGTLRGCSTTSHVQLEHRAGCRRCNRHLCLRRGLWRSGPGVKGVRRLGDTLGSSGIHRYGDTFRHRCVLRHRGHNPPAAHWGTDPGSEAGQTRDEGFTRDPVDEADDPYSARHSSQHDYECSPSAHESLSLSHSLSFKRSFRTQQSRSVCGRHGHQSGTNSDGQEEGARDIGVAVRHHGRVHHVLGAVLVVFRWRPDGHATEKNVLHISRGKSVHLLLHEFNVP